MVSNLVVGVDPGPETSGVAVYDFRTTRLVYQVAEFPNKNFGRLLLRYKGARWAVEMVSAYGKAVGESVFLTCIAIGNLEERAKDFDVEITRITRPFAKVFICNSRSVKGAEFNKGLGEKFPKVGGGRDPVKGIKSQPGALYGIAKHGWAALGIAYTMAHSESYLNRPEWALGRTV
tara:strand:+ start:352 stop:879 length:528 start_codon:yes stop_codon:yes gene_type:complete